MSTQTDETGLPKPIREREGARRRMTIEKRRRHIYNQEEIERALYAVAMASGISPEHRANWPRRGSISPLSRAGGDPNRKPPRRLGGPMIQGNSRSSVALAR
jgi:hypothetical protein